MTGNTKAWLGRFGEVGHPYTHPAAKQCNYSYSHPSTKQCNYSYTHPSTKQCNYSVDTSGFATTTQLNELKTSVSSGKSTIAAAVTDKGVQTAADATFAAMANNIRAIPQPKVNDFIPQEMEENVMLDLTGYSSIGVTATSPKTITAGTYILIGSLTNYVNAKYSTILIECTTGAIKIPITDTQNIAKIVIPTNATISTDGNSQVYIWKKK